MNSLIVTIWGEEKSGKTSLALTFPTPIVHFDLDVGGFARAAWRFKDRDIRSKAYIASGELEKLLKGDISVKTSRRVLGKKELWQEIVVDYAAALQDKGIATIILDSGTQLWGICHGAVLQEKQEAQGPKTPEEQLREKLLPVEYGPANDRMRSILYSARSWGKNLVLTHYPRDIYAPKLVDDKVVNAKTGEVEPDGFKENRRLTDLEISTYLDKGGSPRCKATRSGITLGVLNLELEPTYEAIVAAVKMVRGED